MDHVLYHPDLDQMRVISDDDLRRMRSHDEVQTDDPSFRDEFDLLERQGWEKASPLTIAMILGEVDDEESLWRLHRERWGEANPPRTEAVHPDLMRQLGEVLAHLRAPQADRPRESYTVEEVAAEVKRSVWQVRKWCREGRILARKTPMGDHWLIPHAELTRYRNEGLRPRRPG